MSIKLNNYQLSSGIRIKNSYLSVNKISYWPKSRYLEFLVNLYADNETDYSLETNIISGSFHVDDTSEGLPDLEKFIEDCIIYKIQSVQGKTEEECIEHNVDITDWREIWDYNYTKFNINESSEDEETDEDYIEAARILLEGE